MFEVATRQKYRFPSSKGELSVEQLWDVPLRSKDDFNLNMVARGINRELGVATEESFVDTVKSNPSKKILETKLEIVKHVIAVKVDDEEKAKIRAENKTKRASLLKALAEKQEGKLSEMSEKEIKKQLDALDDE